MLTTVVAFPHLPLPEILHLDTQFLFRARINTMLLNRFPRQSNTILRNSGFSPIIRVWSSSKGSSETKKSDSSSTFPEETVDEMERMTEWIPPNRPLRGGDNVNKSPAISRSKKADRSYPKSNPIEAPKAVDWLSTRRKALSFQKPDKEHKYGMADLEVREGYLLSPDEIRNALIQLGASDVKVALEKRRSLGGAEGQIFATGRSLHHIKLLSDFLVRHLKKRKLGSRGVEGAILGAEGGDSDWQLVDCGNYIVQILSEKTRKQLNLESLCDGTDDLFKVDMSSETEMDEYVSKNPVPIGFGESTNQGEMDFHISQLQRWNIEHKSVVTRSTRRVGSKKRRGRKLF
jgi:ribosomal silencing factor RsfS